MSALTLAPILRVVAARRAWPFTAAVERMAQSLPAVACAGVEFPLGSEDGAVDLQQRVKTPSEIDRLRQGLYARSAAGAEASWRRLLPLCDSRLIGQELDEIWLEVDDGASMNVPSVFGRFSDTLTAPQRHETARRMMAALAMAPRPDQQIAMARCFAASAHQGRISHVGVMLSRAGAPLCLVIDDVPLADVTRVLDALGWPGSTAGAQQRVDSLCASVDRIRLSVTIGDHVEPGLGLECFVGTPDRFDPRWRSVLDRLVVEGLCAPQKRDRMLAWPAAITPHSVTPASWPDALVVDALARNPAEIGWLDRRISHVKISHHDGRPARAKAYLGFVGVWGPAAPVERTSRQVAASYKAAGTVADAIEAAVDYLLGARTQTGWWLDYEGFREGVSDEWVTAYVASALADVEAPRATDAARRAWALLAQRSRDGWGWNSLQPADADSTIWGLRLAARLGESASARALTALRFLRRHVTAGGGVATYLAGAHAAMENSAGAINPEWCSAHGCVTAAAAELESLGDAPLDYLRAHQRRDGGWDGYWWTDPAYATAQAVDALTARRRPDDDVCLDRAVDWARGRVRTAVSESRALGSPFATALALCPLLSASPPRAHADQSLIAHAIGRILACQHDDGSWESSAILSISSAAGAQVPGLDRRRTLTTATVLRTLLRVTPVTARARASDASSNRDGTPARGRRA